MSKRGLNLNLFKLQLARANNMRQVNQLSPVGAGLPDFLAYRVEGEYNACLDFAPYKLHTFFVCYTHWVNGKQVRCSIVDHRTGHFIPDENTDDIRTTVMTDHATAKSAVKRLGPNYCVVLYLKLEDGSSLMLLPDKLWCDKCMQPVALEDRH
jgi:hypothetical protein